MSKIVNEIYLIICFILNPLIDLKNIRETKREVSSAFAVIIGLLAFLYVLSIYLFIYAIIDKEPLWQQFSIIILLMALSNLHTVFCTLASFFNKRKEKGDPK